MTLSCLCGQVHVTVQTRPEYVNECNCTLCRKSGARWGYFHPSEVDIGGSTTGYCRADKEDPNAEVHFCAECGSTTHFILTKGAVAKFGNTLMGVNMWLADERDLCGVEVRYPDGQAWSGAGAFGYIREPRIIS
ncbi:MAG TPA: hypothetical protein VGL73_03850 [Caulobacteraceae bacterium]